MRALGGELSSVMRFRSGPRSTSRLNSNYRVAESGSVNWGVSSETALSFSHENTYALMYEFEWADA